MRTVWLNIAVAVDYAVAGWLGLQFPYYGEHVTLVWAPAAIALAAIVLGGAALLPGIFAGSVALNLVAEPGAWGQATAIALGNTAGPALAGFALVRIIDFRPQLDRVRDALAYAGVGVLGTSVITATNGVISLYAFGDAPLADLLEVWAAWLGGDAAGLLVIGPALLTWFSNPDPSLKKKIGGIEGSAMVLAIASFTALVVAFGSEIPSLPYTFGPIFVWTLLRLGPRGVSLSSAAVVSCLSVGTALGFGPFIAESVRAGMLSLWVFCAAVGSASITASALMCERDRALKNQTRLMRELDHRVKNTLATVIALAERSGDGAVGIEEYLSRFTERLRAVARTHEGMARSDWRSMDLAQVVTMTLAPFDGSGPSHMAMRGIPVTIASPQVAPLTMLLHELATNAAKYGAWARPTGRVEVAWDVADNSVLRLTWRESGGPPVGSNPAPGYGLTLVAGLASHELGGGAELHFAPSGLACTVTVPLVEALPPQ